jgi:hypothetical protein
MGRIRPIIKRRLRISLLALWDPVMEQKKKTSFEEVETGIGGSCCCVLLLVVVSPQPDVPETSPCRETKSTRLVCFEGMLIDKGKTVVVVERANMAC